jgi:hypothetical protein
MGRVKELLLDEEALEAYEAMERPRKMKEHEKRERWRRARKCVESQAAIIREQASSNAPVQAVPYEQYEKVLRLLDVALYVFNK